MRQLYTFLFLVQVLDLSFALQRTILLDALIGFLNNNTGRLTWEKTRLLNIETGMTEWLVTAYYYDKYGRVFQAVSDNHLGGKDYITKKSNFTGQDTLTRHRHVADGTNTYTDMSNKLDHRERLVKVNYRINGGSTILMAGYSYDETGARRVEYLHSENNGAFLQRNNYKYNIRGWLTEINNPSSFNDNSKFGLRLYYNGGPSPCPTLYNGNIAGMLWGTPNHSSMYYVYNYDANNRDTLANFYKSGMSATALDVRYTYDLNGNIKTLNRYGYTGTYIDRLTYTYNGNRITGLSDAAGDIAGVVDYPGSPSTLTNFIYDYNGNLLTEPHKQLGFGFNLLNLPYEINWNGLNRRINYYYNFDGAKLRKRVENNGTLTKVDYCGPFVYETASGVRSLKYMVTPFGRAVKNGSTWDYEYNLTDHLGNVRAVIRKGSNNLAELVQQKHYYPFGMEMSNISLGTGTNKYLYNGKEIQDDFNLYWYDYRARFYDPQLARFHTVDPLAEKFPWATPYSYCFNNPINSIDPDGREPITLSILAARAAIGAAIGAGIDITVQMTANMTLGNQGFWDAASSIDWTSVGASAVTGAVGVPGANVISKTAKVATIATAVAFDAAVDISVAEGNQNIFNGEKSLSTATIDAAGSLIGGKASDDIVRGAKNSISKDISSGTYSTLNKAEKSTLRQTQAVVNSQGFEAGTNTVVKLGAEAGKQGAKSVVGTGSVPNSVVLPQVQNYTQPMDNTRVVRPVYPLR